MIGDFLGGSLLVIGVLVLLAGAAPIIFGVSLMLTSWKPLPPYPSCGGCGYDLTGSLGRTEACPECGAAFARAGIHPAGTGYTNISFIAGAVLAAAGLALLAYICSAAMQ